MEFKQEPVLKIEKLSKIYGTMDMEVRAVDDVDLVVKAGEVVLIMGPSGAGKTSLITMIGALLRPTKGAIFIDGEDITALAEKKRIRLRLHKIGFIFQDFNLLANLTALENIEVPLGLAGVKKEVTRKKAEGLLKVFGLEKRKDFKPAKLSGGEKQMIAVARALANDPKLILADEPTANLDSKRGSEVMRLLRGVAKNMGKTVIVVSHDQRLKEIADRVLWLEDGRFKEMEKMTTDPNCGAQVEMKPTSPHFSYRGKKFWFCSVACLNEYKEKNKIPNSYF